MSQNKVKILVACHKPDTVYQDDVYTPIHVGRAISKYKEEMADMIGDDTGDNISEKNPYYCELTAQYWAWKNLDCEYVGLCHYRRYFKERISTDNLETIMGAADIILAPSFYLGRNILSWLAEALVPDDIYVFFEYMCRRFPSEKETLEKFYVKNNCIHPCNMFVCKKEIFDEFAEWQFSILSDLEKLLIFSGYNHQKRILGYLSETLLSYYVYLHEIKIKEEPIIPMIGDEQELFSIRGISKYKINFSFYRRNRNARYLLPNDIKVGLKNDGILQKLDEMFGKE